MSLFVGAIVPAYPAIEAAIPWRTGKMMMMVAGWKEL